MTIEKQTQEVWVTTDGSWFKDEGEARRHEIRERIRWLLEAFGWIPMEHADVARVLADHADKLQECFK